MKNERKKNNGSGAAIVEYSMTENYLMFSYFIDNLAEHSLFSNTQ